MKKIFTILSVFCAASFISSAEVVDSETALNTAKEFFGAKSMSMVWSGEQTKSASMSAPAYYTFNNPDGGWVIIAGDNCSEPVLAYSMSGSFDPDNLPVNFVGWMNGVSKNIAAVRKAGLTPRTAIKAKWQSPGRTKATSEKLLTTASWDQESPYNLYCPGTYTGCVATAMAIVMRQDAYDVVGKGTIPAYTTATDKKSVSSINIEGYTYNWDNMPLEYTSKATTEQKNAVARLMQHCGAMVQMDYADDGSGAYSSDIIPAMAKYFGYSAAAREVYRYNYSDYDWLAMIEKEIDAGRALIYGAADYDSNSGHQFVLDGYNSDNMVHINWGWSGDCNGWYAACYLGPLSLNGESYVFSYCDSAIIGLTFDPDGTDKTNVELSLVSEEGYNGLALASGTIAKGSSFKLKIGYICNYDYYSDYSGAVKVGLFGADGSLKEYVGSEFSVSLDCLDSSGYPGYVGKDSYSCTITKDIALGDYLQAVYKLTDGTWAPIGAYRNYETTDDLDECYTVGKLGVINLAYLVVPSEPKAGELIYFEMVGSHKLPTAMKWYWDGTQITKGYATPTRGTHTLKAVITYDDNSTETLQKVLNVQ